MQTEALVQTQSSELYLKKLCRHFAHKVPATVDGTKGIIDFPFGRCRLHANSDHLALAIDLKAADTLAVAERVVGEHLQRMASKETLAINWVRTEQ